jgi:adenylate cyclase
MNDFRYPLFQWLASLKPENFRETIGDLENKLTNFNQTLSLVANQLDRQEFDVVLNGIFQAITLKLKELLEADRTTLFLLDENSNELWTILPTGLDSFDSKILEIRIPADAGIVGKVVTSKQVINIRDCYIDPRSTALKEVDGKNNYRTRHILAFPLLNKEGELGGVVQAINKLKSAVAPHVPLAERISQDGFTEQDINRLKELTPSLRLIAESVHGFYKLRANLYS